MLQCKQIKYNLVDILELMMQESCPRTKHQEQQQQFLDECSGFKLNEIHNYKEFKSMLFHESQAT